MASTNDPYAMNGCLVAADTLQKLGGHAARPHGVGRVGVELLPPQLQGLSAAVGSDCLLRGGAAQQPSSWPYVPLLGGMFGPVSNSNEPMKQIVVMQFCVLYNVVIFPEYLMLIRRRKKMAIRRRRRKKMKHLSLAGGGDGSGSGGGGGVFAARPERPVRARIGPLIEPHRPHRTARDCSYPFATETPLYIRLETAAPPRVT